MRYIRETLRMKYVCNCSNRTIARSLGVEKTTVKNCIDRAKAAGLSWPLPDNLSDADLERQLYPRSKSIQMVIKTKKLDLGKIHKELKRKGVTKLLLWEEYKEQNTKGYSFSRFCGLYREWAKAKEVWMPQTYKAGEYTFVDYAGMTVPITNRTTGEIREAQIFVAVLGASSYTYVEATLSQSLPDWIASHCNAFQYFKGVTEIVVPDNLRSGITKAHRYEPDANPTYQEMAAHYGIVIIPARVRKPKDKSLAEKGVLQVEQRILAPLRNHKFFELSELNRAIKVLLEKLNHKPFQKISGSRFSYFEELEKPALKPLPNTPYKFGQWVKVRANKGYLIFFDEHQYSVPHYLAGEEMFIRCTQTTIEVIYQNMRIASHQRSYVQGGKTILPEHMPKSHRQFAEWTPEKVKEEAEKIGKHTKKLINNIIANCEHIYKGVRVSSGIIRLKKSYGTARLESACKRALAINGCSYKSVESILKTGLDQVEPTSTEQSQVTNQPHENIRGGDYFE